MPSLPVTVTPEAYPTGNIYNPEAAPPPDEQYQQYVDPELYTVYTGPANYEHEYALSESGQYGAPPASRVEMFGWNEGMGAVAPRPPAKPSVIAKPAAKAAPTKWYTPTVKKGACVAAGLGVLWLGYKALKKNKRRKG